MVDQAEGLRTLFRDRAGLRTNASSVPDVYTVAVTSGKGGVGKTSIAVNLALLLARSRRQVRLVDADFGLSNVEVLLGTAPKYTLDDVVRGDGDVRDAWFDAPGNIKLLLSGSGVHDMADLDGMTGAELMGHILDSASDGDVVIIDTAPGISASVVSLLTFADEVMVVTTPEPTSVTDTYTAIKVLTSFSPDAEITLVVNSCTGPGQASGVAKGLEDICLRFLQRSFQRYEYVPYDSEVSRAVQSQSPLVVSSPRSAAASWLRKIAIKLDDRIRRRETASRTDKLIKVGA